MDIGFIGLGNMGFHMARRLVEAGHKLTVYDTRPEAIARLTELGAAAASSPREVADAAETVLASLPTPDIVLQVATGKDGVIDGTKVRRFVDLSTTGSRMAIRIAEALGKRNIVQLDSPVSGGVSGAEKGTLAVMVAGPRADFDLLREMLGVIGKVFFIGEKPGMGQTMKLCNNIAVGNRRGGQFRGRGVGREGGPRSRGDDRRDQRRQRTQHRDRGEVHAFDLPADVRLRVHQRPHVQGRAPLPRRGGGSSACRCGSPRRCARCSSSPPCRTAPTRT